MDEGSLELDPFWEGVPGASRTACPIEEPYLRVKVRFGGPAAECVLHLSKVKTGKEEAIRFSFMDGQRVLNSREIALKPLVRNAVKAVDDLLLASMSLSARNPVMAHQLGISPQDLAEIFVDNTIENTIMSEVEGEDVVTESFDSAKNAIRRKLEPILDFGAEGAGERKENFFVFLAEVLLHEILHDKNTMNQGPLTLKARYN
ncbi:MAG: hypothetical protein H6853_05055 [Rhodospirillales bacterium]|nr:hypothetical protein [Alphaproteobacteria bacterium]USO02921.1 MAG: hypothetical protein H6853_05055 [Rhodospirillales bacterium]